jgi:hypothetical protein
VRSRRSLLAAAVGGIAGAIGATLGRPAESRAAVGDALVLGTTNYGGTAATRLNSTSSGGAFWLTQNGSGSGVRGDSPNGHGGVFTTSHVDRYGLFAQQNAGSPGSGAAIQGTGNENIGVRGESSASIGVWGGSTSGYGVYGISTDNAGVYAYSANSYAIYAGGGGAYAAYVDGELYAASASAAVKSFRIDHPLDPAHKVLAHSCVESNERLTLYAGRVTTDSSGEASVDLPAWFDALNTDLRYQLTVIGSFAQAMVKSEVRGRRFVIATSEPATTVCWQLSGVRQDPYAKTHPLVVEAEKVGEERGRYLTPAAFGKPESAGVAWRVRAAAPSGR